MISEITTVISPHSIKLKTVIYSNNIDKRWTIPLRVFINKYAILLGKSEKINGKQVIREM